MRTGILQSNSLATLGLAVMPGFLVLMVTLAVAGAESLFIPSLLSGGLFLAGGILLGAGLWVSGREAGARPRTILNNRVLDSMPEPVILVDSDRNVVTANRAAREVFGRDLVRRNLAMVMRHPDALDAVERVIENRKNQSVEMSISGPVERTFRLDIAALTEAQGGEEGGAVLVLIDMTRTKRSEQMRADFVANVSHELRTPLAALSGFIETLQTSAKDDPEAQERFLDIMATESRRMGRLIEDLLSLSRVEINEHVRPDRQLDLRPLLESVVATLEGRAEKRDMAVDLQIPSELPLVRGDQDELTEVFQNLIDNAIKYSKAGTTVLVGGAIDTDRQMVKIFVKDSGDGIAREHLPRLTERFYRVDKGRSRKMGGTGLGLAIVKHIVSRHGGHLTAESEIGVGSTFSIKLPIFVEDEEILDGEGLEIQMATVTKR